MTVHILVTGVLFREAQSKTSASGKRYVAATLKAAAADNSTADFWNLVVFSENAGAELLRLGLNERLAVQGALKLDTYTAGNGETKISRTVFVDSVLALRASPKGKKPKPPEPAEKPQLAKVNIVPPAPTPSDLNDDIPF